jgi:hypothetical protein
MHLPRRRDTDKSRTGLCRSSLQVDRYATQLGAVRPGTATANRNTSDKHLKMQTGLLGNPRLEARNICRVSPKQLSHRRLLDVPHSHAVETYTGWRRSVRAEELVIISKVIPEVRSFERIRSIGAEE